MNKEIMETLIELTSVLMRDSMLDDETKDELRGLHNTLEERQLANKLHPEGCIKPFDETDMLKREILAWRTCFPLMAYFSGARVKDDKILRISKDGQRIVEELNVYWPMVWDHSGKIFEPAPCPNCQYDEPAYSDDGHGNQGEYTCRGCSYTLPVRPTMAQIEAEGEQ